MASQLDPSSIAQEVKHYEYRPLDHDEPSIRLVQVLPALSPQGHIQCRMLHGTVYDTYTCVSYRWGSKIPSHDILVDGRTFAIRRNLFDFLAMIYNKIRTDTLASEPYWIDALSIDQTNTLERNHQVTQMGKIFSGARIVNIWLGVLPDALLPLMQMLPTAKDASFQDWTAINTNEALFNEYIFDNEYWKRAWITQEILLAHHVTICLNAQSIELTEMIEGCRYFCLTDESSQIRTPFNQFTRDWRYESSRPKNIISLLDHFRDKQCHDPRDRIYSLLSLCTGSSAALPVDYDMPLLELAVQVLERCTENLCLCSAALVIQALELLETEPLHNSNNMPSLAFDVIMDWMMPGTTRHFVYCYQMFEPSRVPQRGNYYGFHDTCESFALKDFHFSWDSATSNGRPVHWNHPESSIPQSTSVREEECFFHHQGAHDDFSTIRLSLPLLAKMLTHPIDLCRHARTSRLRRDDVLVGYPRIRYPSDTLNFQYLPEEHPMLYLPMHLVYEHYNRRRFLAALQKTASEWSRRGPAMVETVHEVEETGTDSRDGRGRLPR